MKSSPRHPGLPPSPPRSASERRRRPEPRQAPPAKEPEGPDEIIHQSTRLRLVAALKALPDGESIEFPRLKAIMKLTDGNLGAHLTTLANASYVTVTKDEHDRRPRTLITLTQKGRRAFDKHILFLRGIIDG